MIGWSVLVYFSVGIVYLAVAATIWGWIRYGHRKDRD